MGKIFTAIARTGRYIVREPKKLAVRTDNAEWVEWLYVLSFFLAYLLVFSPDASGQWKP